MKKTILFLGVLAFAGSSDLSAQKLEKFGADMAKQLWVRIFAFLIQT